MFHSEYLSSVASGWEPLYMNQRAASTLGLPLTLDYSLIHTLEMYQLLLVPLDLWSKHFPEVYFELSKL